MSRAIEKILWLAILSLVASSALAAGPWQRGMEPEGDKRTTAQPAKLAPEVKLYRAREADLPDWARQGAFCYLRLDGGPIEAEKAVLSNWRLSPENLAVLAGLYDQHSERMIALLKESGFTWIWITYSNGFSIQHEAQQRRQCRSLIERCHKQGIRVCAYMSLTNMFWRNMFHDEPQSKAWVNIEGGKPALYGGCPQRYLADINHPGWRAYVKRRVELALEDGVDAIFYDNMWADQAGMRTLLSEVQDRLVEHAQRTGQPKIPLMANSKESPDRIDMHDICEMFWAEYGLGTPGVWDGVWYVDNAMKTRHAKGNSPRWKPLAYDLPAFHKGDRLSTILSPREEQRTAAEAVAMGGALCRLIEGKMVERLIGGQPDALANWRAAGLYNKFLLAHKDLYLGAQPAAAALALQGFDDNVYRMLLRAGVQYELCQQDRLDIHDAAGKYTAVVVPPSITLDAKALANLEARLQAGAKLLVSREHHAEAAQRWPSYTDAELEEIRTTGRSESFLKALAGAAPASCVQVDPPHVLASHMRLPDGREALHLVNCNAEPLEKVTVRLTPLRKSSGAPRLVSPDPAGTTLKSVRSEQGQIVLEIGNLDIYAVVELP